MTKEALIKSQNPLAGEFNDDTPLYHNENLETGKDEKIQNLFEQYCFYPAYFDKYQCKPEIILLAMSLFEYLNNYANPSDRNCSSVMFLLKQPFCYGNSKESNMDKLLKDVNERDPYADCLEYYRMFFEANNSRKRDAIVSLYEYYAYGVYTIKEIVDSPHKLHKWAETIKEELPIPFPSCDKDINTYEYLDIDRYLGGDIDE